MSGSRGFAVSRTRGGDRFYSPPALRRQQQQLQRTVKSEAAAAAAVEAENRTDSDDSMTTLSKPPSVCSSSPPRPSTDVTNLDRLTESVTPFIRAQHWPQANSNSWRTGESDMQPYYFLEDLWESFREWSVYGVGVPLLLNGKDSIIQYYCPFLSGIQLYVDPQKSCSRLRRPGEESDAESSRETSSGGSSDCEGDRRAKQVIDGPWSQRNLMNSKPHQVNRPSLRDKSLMSSSSEEVEMSSSSGTLAFEFLEREPPYMRKPLTDKISHLASQFPELGMYRSCDLLPSSWISVAWYPIYRIPVGPTLKDFEASFLTFHSLSTHSRSNSQPQFHVASGRTVPGVADADASSKISLPVFGLASYKLQGSILTPTGPHECQQENSLLEAVDNWLQRLQVDLPDYQFFRDRYVSWRQWGDEVPSDAHISLSRGQ